jgi:transposase-like protein
MRQRDQQVLQSAEETVRDIRRATRRHFSAEEKIRIVLEGLRGEDSISVLWSKEASPKTSIIAGRRSSSMPARGGSQATPRARRPPRPLVPEALAQSQIGRGIFVVLKTQLIRQTARRNREQLLLRSRTNRVDRCSTSWQHALHRPESRSYRGGTPCPRSHRTRLESDIASSQASPVGCEAAAHLPTLSMN